VLFSFELNCGIANLHRRYYCCRMTTISIKLPDELEAQVEAEAKRRQTSKSSVIRDCLKQSLSKRKRFVSCADLAGDLIGSQPGPRDASTNKKYMEDFGSERRHRSR